MARGEEKTEQPTARRLREARREGRLPQSIEVPQFLTLIAAVVVLPGLVARLSDTLSGGWKEATLSVDARDPAPALRALGDLVTRSLLLLVPLVGATIVAAIAARAILGGIHLNPYHLKPKAKQLNPFPGIKRLLSIRQIGQLARLILKLTALAAVVALLWDRFVVATFLGPASLGAFTSSMGNALWALLMGVLALSAATAGLDGTLAVRRYRKDLRMSRQEVRDDARQTETNPQIKGEVRARQRKMSRMRMMAAVAHADVVLTNPTHLAVALRYEPDSSAPEVVAKGADHMAARIREVAKGAGVPIRENKPLARALYQSVEIGEQIPVHLYQAVAEVLAVVYKAAREGGRQVRAS